jgi:cytochrome P450
VQQSVNDLDLPFIKNIDTKKHNINQNLQISKDSWIAKNYIGYSILSHEDCSSILKDSRWHSALGLLMELNPNMSTSMKERRKKGLGSLNDEAHNKIKKLITPAFNSSYINQIRPFMKEVIENLIEPYLSLGEVDLQKDIFFYYPIPIICKVLGIPKVDLELFSNWSKILFNIFNLSGEFDQTLIENAQKEFDLYSLNLIEEKRKNKTNDLLSQLIEAEESGDRLSSENLIMLIEIIIASGIDTTRSQLGLAMKLLLDNPELINIIKKDNTKVSFILSELIRSDTVLRGTLRVASENIVYRGILFPKGTLVYVNIVMSNLDEEIFEDPLTINLDRHNTHKSLSFGAGIHYCLGHALGRAELEEALIVIINKIDNIKLSGEITNLPKTSIINGYQSIPITFDKV